MLDETLFREYAMRFIGLPYIWGGDDPILGFDCSGLAQVLLEGFGADPIGDQTAQALFNHFASKGPFEEAKIGALAFYGMSKSHVSHVAICLNSQTVIEAGGGSSKTLSQTDAIRQNAYVRLRPVKYRKDFIGCLLPDYP